MSAVPIEATTFAIAELVGGDRVHVAFDDHDLAGLADRVLAPDRGRRRASSCRRSAVCGELRYLGIASPSARPPKPTTLPFAVADREHQPIAEPVVVPAAVARPGPGRPRRRARPERPARRGSSAGRPRNPGRIRGGSARPSPARSRAASTSSRPAAPFGERRQDVTEEGRRQLVGLDQAASGARRAPARARPRRRA